MARLDQGEDRCLVADAFSVRLFAAKSLSLTSLAGSSAKLALPSGLAKLRGTGTRESSSMSGEAKHRRTADDPVLPAAKWVRTS